MGSHDRAVLGVGGLYRVYRPNTKHTHTGQQQQLIVGAQQDNNN